MNLDEMADSTSRLVAFVEELTNVIGHSDRVGPLRHYCAGLLVSEGRRSAERIAAVTAPAEASMQHQKLLHFVANAPWLDAPVLAKVREMVLPALERHEPIEAWIIDDTSFPKYGSHSVGLRHQYCGQLGKQANCQVAVTLSIANHHASLPIAYRLYLPKAWAEDTDRRKKAGIPKAVSFRTKWQIALEQIRGACAAGVPRGAVLMDADYGRSSALRAGISAEGLTYVAAVPTTVKVRRVCDDDAAPEARLSVKQLALRLPKHAWRTVSWREGTNKVLRSRFARVQVQTSPTRGRRGRPEETLLIEWPKEERKPTKYWLATVDRDTSFRDLVDLATLRWRIERDYLELKQEIGLGHYEGRGWRGFHHHATLCIAAYGFLISEREMIPPSEAHFPGTVKKPAIPESYRPRGASDSSSAPRSQLDCDTASLLHRRNRKSTPKVSVLRKTIQKEHASHFMTQYH
jgi:SRSO17 transposase